MHPANERQRYNVTSSPIGWAHTQNDPCWSYIGSKYTQSWHIITCSLESCEINTLRPRQYGRCSAANISKCIFFNENMKISIEFSMKFVPKGSINKIPTLDQITAWHQQGSKPLSEPMMVYRCIYASLGLNELMKNCSLLTLCHIFILKGKKNMN